MPQRGIPYVHMGRSIVLHSRSLFSIDICECLPMIQYIRLNESLWDNVEKSGAAGQATDENTAHAQLYAGYPRL